MAKILVVEDDAELLRLVESRLLDSGYEVVTATTGTEALTRVADSSPDLVLLDVMIPEMDGIEVCRRIRIDNPLLYVIMLTARAEEIDRVVGLEVGADDYVTKPFSLQELVARIRSALRRLRLTAEHAADEGEEDKKPVTVDAIHVDPIRREVKKNDDIVHLTVREFDLLYFLASNAGRPFTRLQLLEKVWDIHYEGYDRTVDSHVQRLRAKIEDEPGKPLYLRTVWGVGYKFESPSGAE